MNRATTRRLTLHQRATCVLVACALFTLVPSTASAQQPPYVPPAPRGQAQMPESPAKTNVISVALRSDWPQMKDTGEGRWEVSMDGLDYVSIAGAPRLPVQHVEVPLPAGARLADYSLQDVTLEPVAGTYDLVPVMPEAESEGGLQAPVVFEPPASHVFPEFPLEVSAVHQRGDVQVITFRFYPLQYNLETRTLTLIRSARLSVRYQSAGRTGRRADIGQSTQAGASDAPIASVQSANSPGYAIAVRTDLAQAASIQDFKRHKESEGFTVYLITPDAWANYEGKDGADKLRAFLQDKRQAWNLQYLLIIGSASSIPMKTLYPSNTDHKSTWATPSDMYYADLTGNWDKDRDGFPGEFRDDAVDFGAELLVGRIPFDAETLINPVLQRTIAYETTYGEWRKRALLAMAILDYQTNGNPETDGAYLGEAMRGYLSKAGFSTWRMYEEDGNGTRLPHEAPLDRDALAASWKGGYGFVSWWGHGSSTGAYRTLWASNQTVRKPFADIYHLSAMATDNPPIVFQNACSNGVPQTYSLAAQVLRYGAIATVAPTAITWYRTGWRTPADGGSATLAYYFGDELITKEQTVGQALARAREIHAARYLSSPGQQQTVLAFALYGDPSLQMKPRERQQTTVEIAVKEGWNLLAMPALTQPLPLPDALSSIAGVWQEVHAYDPTDADQPWKVLVAGTPTQANTLRELKPLQGFWLLANADATLTLSVPASLTAAGQAVPIYPGWNLVGFPGNTAMATEDALRPIASVVEAAFALDSSGEGAWLSYTPSAAPEANTLRTFEPKRGYWIYATASASWQVP